MGGPFLASRGGSFLDSAEAPPRARASGLRGARGGWRRPIDGAERIHPKAVLALNKADVGHPQKRTRTEGGRGRSMETTRLADGEDAVGRWVRRARPMGPTYTGDHRGPIRRWVRRVPGPPGTHPPMGPTWTGTTGDPSPDGSDVYRGPPGTHPPMGPTWTGTTGDRSADGSDVYRGPPGTDPPMGPTCTGTTGDRSADGSDVYRGPPGTDPPMGRTWTEDHRGPIPRWVGRGPRTTGDPSPDGSDATPRWARRLPLTATSRPMARDAPNKIKRFPRPRRRPAAGPPAGAPPGTPAGPLQTSSPGDPQRSPADQANARFATWDHLNAPAPPVRPRGLVTPYTPQATASPVVFDQARTATPGASAGNRCAGPVQDAARTRGVAGRNAGSISLLPSSSRVC